MTATATNRLAASASFRGASARSPLRGALINLHNAAARSQAGRRVKDWAPMKELDRVQLIADEVVGQITVPGGSAGTIVHKYAGGAAFEVEFTVPVEAVATVERASIKRL